MEDDDFAVVVAVSYFMSDLLTDSPSKRLYSDMISLYESQMKTFDQSWRLRPMDICRRRGSFGFFSCVARSRIPFDISVR